MIHEIFNNEYWKILFVVILSLLATFAHEIDVLKDGAIAYIIFVVLLFMIYAKEDLGLIILVSVIFLLAYNNVVYKN